MVSIKNNDTSTMYCCIVFYQNQPGNFKSGLGSFVSRKRTTRIVDIWFIHIYTVPTKNYRNDENDISYFIFRQCYLQNIVFYILTFKISRFISCKILRTYTFRNYNVSIDFKTYFDVHFDFLKRINKIYNFINNNFMYT